MASKLYTSQQQLHIIVNFMEKNGDLSWLPASQKSESFWSELADLLNDNGKGVGGGSARPVHKWQRLWSDWKTRVKKKAFTKPSSQKLTVLEQRVLRIKSKAKKLKVEQDFDAKEPKIFSIKEEPHERLVDCDPADTNTRPYTSLTTQKALPTSQRVPIPSSSVAVTVTTPRRNLRTTSPTPTSKSPLSSASSTPGKMQDPLRGVRQVTEPKAYNSAQFDEKDAMIQQRLDIERGKLELDRVREANRRDEALKSREDSLRREANRREDSLRWLQAFENFTSMCERSSLFRPAK